MTARPLALTFAAAVTCALLAACASSLPVAQQSGAQLYDSQGCHRCHASDGSGSFFGFGPNLRDKRPYWDVDALASYLADTDAYAADDPRLTPGKMASYGHLDEAARRRLAEHVLGLMDEPAR